ncbi:MULTISPECIES: DNA polymerase III subunit beta [Streptomyces]|uniref:DNA polymerase-3 subunit beta n=1 Tax=Streptomyces harbinensis TaxID=1176198 RepID=A0A1I6WAJ2_9ACTN|nr:MULTISPECIES: DNA polymerase III subunit beta [Streptomyces]SFT23026.1 DNA polymerase-3 subunit beta [Streptomyces harbinensis]
MKLSVSTTALAAAATTAAKALTARPAIPVLAALKLAATGSRLTIAGFDYETSTTQEIGATVHTGGEALVPGRLLADIARLLPGHEAAIELNGPMVEITSDTASYTVHTLPLDEYPSLPDLPAASGRVDAALLRAAIGQVAPAADTNGQIPMLTGVLVQADATHLTLVATDRYRMPVRRIPWQTEMTEPASAMVYATTLQDLAAALPEDEDGTVDLALPSGKSGLFGVQFGSSRITTRVLDAEMTHWQRIMAAVAALPITLRVQTAALAAAVKRVAVVAERAQPIRLDMTAGRVELVAGTKDEARARDRIDGDLTGTNDALSMCFNPAFLASALAAVDTDEVEIGISAPAKPALLTPATGGEPADSPLRYLLMPIRPTS